MAISDLQEAWKEYLPQKDADYMEWDERRLTAITPHRDALDSFLSGETDLSSFRTKIDSLSKSQPLWGFRGTSQMFFNQLVKAAEPLALGKALKAVLPAPADTDSAKEKLEAFLAAVEDARDRAEKIGATQPGSGRIDAFVSFFWELQDREEWPTFFPNSRNVLERQGLLDVNQRQPELYIAYRELIQRLKEVLETDTWGVEHLLWHLGQGAPAERGSEPETGGGAGPPDPERKPKSDNLYASYREQGLHFPDEIVTSLVLSLATKRLVILTGISGTGKSQIALGLARHLEAVGGASPDELEPPESDPENLYVKLTAPKLQRGSVSLVSDAREYVSAALGLPERGASTFYTVELPDRSIRKMRLNNVGFSDPTRRLFRLYLLREVTEWLRAHSKPGDYLRLALKPRDGVDFGLDVVKGSPASGTDLPKRHVVVPVRSNWTDPRGLVGYFNPLTRAYVQTDLIELLLRAGDDPENPYLLILDEMNLARVEYYFSDFLSALESGEDLKLMASGVAEESAASSQDGGEAEVPGELQIPPNVCFIGTVNIDETTHAFSPKVLDRANVIEFSEVDVERALGHGVEKPEGGLRLKGGKFAAGWLCASKLDSLQPKAVAHGMEDFTGALEDVHAILAGSGLPFGYRVIDEVSAFVGHAVDKSEGEPEEVVRRAFDLQLRQKIVPKLSGGRELEMPLATLLDYCLDGEKRSRVDVEEVKEVAAKRLKSTDSKAQLRYPGSAEKILRMLTRLADTGFVGALE